MKRWGGAVVLTAVLGTAMPLPVVGSVLTASAQAPKAVLTGRLSFINDFGTVMIDIGSDENGWQKLGVKLMGVEGKDGLKVAATKLIPIGSLVRVEIMKSGNVPEVVLKLGTRNLNDQLRKQGFVAK